MVLYSIRLLIITGCISISGLSAIKEDVRAMVKLLLKLQCVTNCFN